MTEVILVFNIPADNAPDPEPAGTVLYRMEIEGEVSQFLAALNTESANSQAEIAKGATPGTLFQIVNVEQLVGQVIPPSS